MSENLDQAFNAAKFLNVNTTMELAQWESAAKLNKEQANQLAYPSSSPVKYAAAAGLFEPKGCFMNIKSGEKDFNAVYCYGNSLIMVLSFINIILFAFVLCYHVKAYKRTMDCA